MDHIQTDSLDVAIASILKIDTQCGRLDLDMIGDGVLQIVERLADVVREHLGQYPDDGHLIRFRYRLRDVHPQLEHSFMVSITSEGTDVGLGIGGSWLINTLPIGDRLKDLAQVLDQKIEALSASGNASSPIFRCIINYSVSVVVKI